MRTATFGGEGQSLPIIQRQFISLSWGGKNIEDFDLLITYKDYMERELYAPYDNFTTNYVGVDGQSYWLSSHKARTLTYTLSTDGMSTKKLEDFKAHFKPGLSKKLILTEFPYRYAMARVNVAPIMALMPFETTESIMLNGEEKQFRTTEYRGNITLEFVLDDPFWYSEVACLDSQSEEALQENFTTGIPLKEQIKNNATYFLATKVFSNGKEASSLECSANTPLNLYYCGTASALPIIKFNITAARDANGYFSMIPNSYAPANGKSLASLSIGDNTMFYTLPPYLLAYNFALDFMLNETSNLTVLQVCEELREKIGHPIMRKQVLDILNEETKAAVFTSVKSRVIGKLKNVFGDFYLIFIIDCQQGIVEVQYVGASAQIQKEFAATAIKSAFPKIEGRSCIKDGELSDFIKVLSSINLKQLQIDYRYTFY